MLNLTKLRLAINSRGVYALQYAFERVFVPSVMPDPSLPFEWENRPIANEIEKNDRASDHVLQPCILGQLAQQDRIKA